MAKVAKETLQAGGTIGTISERDLEISLKHSMRDSVFNSIAFSFTSVFFAAYAIALGAGSAYIGMLAALPVVFWTAAQIPAAWLVERIRRRKVVVMLAMAGSRAMLVPLMVIPFIEGSGQLYALLGFITASSFFSALADPAMTSWLGDLVPHRIHGYFFARRLRMSKLFSVVALVFAGITLGFFPASDLRGFQIIFLLGIMFGFMSLLGVFRISEPPSKIKRNDALDKYYRRTPSYRRLKRFLAAFFVWHIGVTISTPFFVVKLLDGMRAPYYWVSVMAVAMSMSMVSFQALWGRHNDRFGSRAVMILAASAAAFYPFLWMFASQPVHAIPIEIFGGMTWAGFNLTYFNYLLEISPSQRRHRFSAMFSIVMGSAGVIGPLAGGWLSGYFESRHLLVFTGVDAVFFISWTVRLIGALLFATLLEEIDVRGKVKVSYVFSEMVRHGHRRLVSMVHVKERAGMKEVILSELGIGSILDDIAIAAGNLHRQWDRLGRWKKHSDDIVYAAYSVERGARLLLSYAPDKIRVYEHSHHHEIARMIHELLENVHHHIAIAHLIKGGHNRPSFKLADHEIVEIHRNLNEAMQHMVHAHHHFKLLHRKGGYLRVE
jgi:MFS family permease